MRAMTCKKNRHGSGDLRIDGRHLSGDDSNFRQVPHWDAVARRLTIGRVLIKQFRQAAENQTLVLATFEEQGWPPVIENPLPDDGFVDRLTQLYETVNSLNRNRKSKLLSFHTSGCGSSIRWELEDATSVGESPKNHPRITREGPQGKLTNFVKVRASLLLESTVTRNSLCLRFSRSATHRTTGPPLRISSERWRAWG